GRRGRRPELAGSIIQQDAQLTVAVADHDVKTSIAIHISERHEAQPGRRRRYGFFRCVFEPALSVAKHRRHQGRFGTEAFLSAHGHDIEATVSVNVAKGEHITLLTRMEGRSRPW